MLPTHETRHERYVGLFRERFGESPKKICEGLTFVDLGDGPVELPRALCPLCLLPVGTCPGC